MSSRYLELAPSNKTTDDKYAFKKGVAQINWTIPEGNYVLDPTSVRIVGDIRYYKDEAGTAPIAGEALTSSARLGVWACFQQLIWRSSKHQTTLSHERNWNRWLSSYISLTSSTTDDALSHFSESALTLPNYEAHKRSVVAGNAIHSFCCHLPCSMLNSGASIPLTGNTLGGLDLSIMLESDAMALQVLPANFSTDPAVAGFEGAYYEMSNIKLVCSVITPPPDQLSRLLSQKEGSMTIQAIHSYYDTANSQNLQLSMNFALNKVKSLYVNFIPSNKLNNLANDSFATLDPMNTDGIIADILKISVLRGGTLFPKLFPRDCNIKEEIDTMMPDPILIKDYINSVVAFDKATHIQGSLANANRNYVGKVVGGVDTGIPYQLVNNGGVVAGVGVNFDNFLGGSGVDMNSVPFGLAIESNLTTNNSQSLFVYVNAETTILFNQSGIQVLQ